MNKWGRTVKNPPCANCGKPEGGFMGGGMWGALLSLL